MKKFAPLFAIFLIASYAITTRANPQNVYRCGSTYSQTPCPDGVPVDVQDARTAQQKAETDAATRRNANAADAMERARLQEEAQQKRALAKAARAKKPASSAADGASPSAGGSGTLTTQRVHVRKKYRKEPDFFPTRSAPLKKPGKPASKPK